MNATTFAPPAIAFGPRWPVTDALVRDQVIDVASETPQHPAIIEHGEVTTYGDLAAQSASIAAWLLQHALADAGPEPIVAVVGGRSSMLIAGLLGVWRAGGVYLPIAADYPLSRIQYLLGDARPLVTLVDEQTTDHDLIAEIRTLSTTVTLSEAAATTVEPTFASQLDPQKSANNAAYVIYTSGSTGQPKGAILSHKNVRNFVTAHRADIGLTSLDQQGWSGNVSFDASVADLWPALCCGSTISIAPLNAGSNLRVLLAWLRDSKITCTLVPTAAVNMLFGLEDDWWRDLSMRVMLTGGDRLTRRPPPGVPFTLINAYGPTEATVWTTLQRVPNTPMRGGFAAPSIGRPIANTFVTILDDDLRQCVVGQQGELCIGGDGVARGYLGRPDVTAERFISDVWSDPSSGTTLYRTGDQAVMLPGGWLKFVGRADRQIAIQGYRIEAGEVESVLHSDPLINEAIVKRHDYETLGPRLIAFCTLSGGGTGNEEVISTLRTNMKAKVPAYMVPNQFVVLSEMPMTPNGKVDDHALVPPSRSREGLVAEGKLEATMESPAGRSEQRVAEVFADVLELDVVGRDDSFFAIGGDSLAGVSVLARLEPSARVALPDDALQQAPTPRELGALLEGVVADSSPAASLRDWEAESKLDLGFQKRRSPEADGTVLVTGAGGFIGSAVVQQLLDQGAAVRALVHSTASAERLQAQLTGELDHLTLETGDLARPDLGLSEQTHVDIARSTRAIIHAGAAVNHYQTYEALREINVEATSTLARTAWVAGGGSVPFVFASSISVDEAEREGVLSTNGYVRGKQIAERRLQAAAEQGLPVSVLRIARAMPNSRGGPFNPRDTLGIFFHASLALGCSPQWQFSEAAHPVDVLARHLSSLAMQHDSDGRYEVHHPPMGRWSSANMLSALQDALVARGETPLDIVSAAEWRQALLADERKICRQATSLLSVNALDDLTSDNSTQMQALIDAMPVGSDEHWQSFDDAAYARMAFTLIEAKS